MPFQPHLAFNETYKFFGNAAFKPTVEEFRKFANRYKGGIFKAPSYDDTCVRKQKLSTLSYDGTMIDLYLYSSVNKEAKCPAVLYCHGGGFVVASILYFEDALKYYVAKSNVTLLGVEYRKAPEFPYPTPQEDCYVGLKYLYDHGSELDINVDRIAIMGSSAGGGLAASVTIMARDRKLSPPIKLQILNYPMLNDKETDANANNSTRRLAPLATWTYEINKLGWESLLSNQNLDTVPVDAAPYRLEDFSNLPPAHITCGMLDILRDESVSYASRLWSAGINCDLRIVSGAPHLMEYAGDDELTHSIWDERIRVLKSI